MHTFYIQTPKKKYNEFVNFNLKLTIACISNSEVFQRLLSKTSQLKMKTCLILKSFIFQIGLADA